MLCGPCVKPKKQLKVQIIGILEEWTPFNDPKCTYEKVTKNLDRALPLPSFGQDPKEQQLLFVKPSLWYISLDDQPTEKNLKTSMSVMRCNASGFSSECICTFGFPLFPIICRSDLLINYVRGRERSLYKMLPL